MEARSSRDRAGESEGSGEPDVAEKPAPTIPAHSLVVRQYQPRQAPSKSNAQQQQASPVYLESSAINAHTSTSQESSQYSHCIPEPSPDDESARAMMYVEVQKTQQKKRGRTSKPDTVTFGPASLPLDISWDAFLASIAGVVGTKPDYLNVSSFQFRTAKSSTSKTLPVTNALGLKAVHKELVSKAKTGSEPFLCITMAEPRKAQSWELAASTQGAAGAGMTGSLDELDISDDDTMGPIQKKGKLDKSYAPYLRQIYEKIDKDPPCPLHPKIRCVQNRATGDHFDVTEGRATIWAAQIERSEADLDNPPFGYQLWKRCDAKKKTPIPPPPPESSSSVTAPADGFTAAAAAAIAPSPPGAPFGFYPFPHPAMFNPYAYPPPTFTPPSGPFVITSTTAAATVSDMPDIRSSSPPVPDEVLDLEEFCEKYKIDDEDMRALGKLRFRPGDKLSVLSEADWSEVGFTKLSWKRVCHANRKYIDSLKSNSL